MSLILWIARKHYGCRHLNDYVDDVFAAALATSLLLYPRYMVLMPRPQVTGVEMIWRSVHRRTVPKESDVLRSAHGVPMTANG